MLIYPKNSRADIAKIDSVHINIPTKFESVNGEQMVIKMYKSLYIQYEAPHMRYENNISGIEDPGFNSSNLDPCIFVEDKLICVSFVDDSLFFTDIKNTLM